MGCPEDLAEWFEERGLTRRRDAMRKNLSVAMADAVGVAEIIHAYYPKLVQLHSYTGQSSTEMRLSNWKHLNTRVLRVLHCEVSSDLMTAFAQRMNEAALVDYLRTLRVQLPAFEPLYLVEFHASSDPAVQAMAVARLSAAGSKPKPPPAPEPSDPAPPPSASGPSPFSVKTMKLSPGTPGKAGSGSVSGSSSSTAPYSESPVARRPSMAHTNKILDAQKRSREDVKRRASLMTTQDIDAEYQRLSSRLQQENKAITADVDHLERRSSMLDAQLNAYKVQNEKELKKTERRLSVLKMQLHDAETGQSVVVDEDVKYKDVYDTTQNSTFARRLSVNLVEIAQTVSSLEDALNEKAVVPPARRASYTSSGYNSSSQAPDTSASTVQKRPFQGGSASSLFPSASSSSSGGAGRGYGEEEEDEDDEDDEVPPPPPPKASSSSSSSSSAPQQQSSSSGRSSSSESSAAKALGRLAALSLTEIREEEEENEGEEEASAAKGNSKSTSSAAAAAVTHERLFSQSKGLYYYVDVASGESSWHPPSRGSVLCSDDQGRQYAFDVESGTSTWIKYH